MIDKDIIIALPKGRILKQVSPILDKIGIIPEESFFNEKDRKLKFETKEEAIQYAKSNNLLYFIEEGSEKKMNIRKNGYGENFDYSRRRPWTH